jgi:deazaflavin-dependent oxidoreductase (nitroreductase family)
VSTPDLVAMNAAMTATILDGPAQPLPEDGYALRVLYSSGRRSGQRRATPLAVVRHDGRLHLVSPERQRAWVRNLAADPRCEVASADGVEAYLAVPLDPPEAAPVVATYLASMQVPWALSAFPVGAGASLDEITVHLGGMAVLRLDPR